MKFLSDETESNLLNNFYGPHNVRFDWPFDNELVSHSRGNVSHFMLARLVAK